MKRGKRFGFMAVAAALMALAAAQSAPATELEVGGVTQGSAVTLTMSLASGTSLVLRNTAGETLNTCTGSHMHGDTVSPFYSVKVNAPLTTLLFSNCSQGKGLEVIRAGILNFEHIPNTTNGTVRWENLEVKVPTPSGTVTCKTEASGGGTDIGTLTGTGDLTKHATIDMNAVLNCGFLYPSVQWQGTYAVTSPTGLGVTDPPTALEVGGSVKNESVELTGSLAAGSSLSLKAFGSLVLNTCTESHLQGATISPFTGTQVAMPIKALTFSGCAKEPIVVHKAGRLTVQDALAATSGTVRWEDAEFTVPVNSSVLTCKIGAGGTDIGTLSGVGKATEHATLNVNAIIECSGLPNVALQATYTITSPTGLGVTS